jgi:hypothetical protein
VHFNSTDGAEPKLGGPGAGDLETVLRGDGLAQEGPGWRRGVRGIALTVPIQRANAHGRGLHGSSPDNAVCHNGTGLKPRRFQVIDTLLNLLFRCSHQRMTRPLAPITKAGQPHSQSYVVCLDCGKQFEYDMTTMRMGKLIDHSHDACVVPKDPPPATKVKYAVLAAVPVAIVIGAVLTAKKSDSPKTARTADKPDGD